MLAVLHDPNHAVRADRLVLMRHGRLRAAGPPETVLMPDTMADTLGVRLQIVRNAAAALRFVP